MKQETSKERENKENLSVRNSGLREWLNAIVLTVGFILSYSVVALLPSHNVMKNPEFWYEAIILWLFGQAPIVSLFVIYHCKNVMKTKEIWTAKVWLLIVLGQWFVTAGLYSNQYVIWTMYLGFYQPLPHNGPIGAFSNFLVVTLSLWWLFPAKMRADPHYRQRIKAYVAYTFWYLYMVILTFVFGQMTIPFFSSDYLWLIGLEFGLIREFNQWVMNKLIFKAAETNDFYSIGALNLQLVTLTNLTVVVFISTVADQKTTACFIAVDFVMNSMLTLKTIRAYKRVNPREVESERFIEMADQLITTLIINESMELLVPIMYMISLAIAFCGPNAGNLGNIGNSYWHFQQIDDIWTYFNGASQMALVDLFLTGLSFLLIWKFTNIGVTKKCKDIIKSFGATAAIYLPMILNAVCRFL